MLKLKEVVEDEQDVHLILELCPGGNLFDRVATHPYTERESAFVLRSLISAVHYMHHCGCIHRDIKPENVFLSRRNSNVSVRLGDFGQACRVVKGENHSIVCGSSYYVAPEVIGRCYNKEADIWSLGVLLYVLLCGRPPFSGSSHDKILGKIRAREADFDRGPWKNISEEAIDLVRRMLTKDTSKRITVTEIKKHPWVIHHCPPAEPCPSPSGSTASSSSSSSFTHHATPPRSPWSASTRSSSRLSPTPKSMSGEYPAPKTTRQPRRSSAEYCERDSQGCEKGVMQYQGAVVVAGNGRRRLEMALAKRATSSESDQAAKLVGVDKQPVNLIEPQKRACARDARMEGEASMEGVHSMKSTIMEAV